MIINLFSTFHRSIYDHHYTIIHYNLANRVFILFLSQFSLDQSVTHNPDQKIFLHLFPVDVLIMVTYSKSLRFIKGKELWIYFCKNISKPQGSNSDISIGHLHSKISLSFPPRPPSLYIYNISFYRTHCRKIYSYHFKGHFLKCSK